MKRTHTLLIGCAGALFWSSPMLAQTVEPEDPKQEDKQEDTQPLPSLGDLLGIEEGERPEKDAINEALRRELEGEQAKGSIDVSSR